ncbi:hypothetical protein LCGC14_2391440, partial [marine sediment metagenome]
ILENNKVLCYWKTCRKHKEFEESCEKCLTSARPIITKDWVRRYSSKVNTDFVKSVDNGVSWVERYRVQYDGALPSGGVCVSCPYEGNEAGKVVYWSEDSKTYISKDSGVTNTAIGPTPGTSWVLVTRTGIETYTDGSHIVSFWDEATMTLHVSIDRAVSWSTKGMTGIVGDQFCAAGGFPMRTSNIML